MMDAQVAMNARALDAHEDAKVETDPGDIVARSTIAAAIIARQLLHVADHSLLQLHEAGTHLRIDVLECLG